MYIWLAVIIILQLDCSSVVLVSSSAISAATLSTGSSPRDTTMTSPGVISDGHKEDERENEQEGSLPGATYSNCLPYNANHLG